MVVEVQDLRSFFGPERNINETFEAGLGAIFSADCGCAGHMVPGNDIVAVMRRIDQLCTEHAEFVESGAIRSDMSRIELRPD
jgi:hypothetical protein